MSPTFAPSFAAIAAGQAVRHRTRRDYVGRVWCVNGRHATVVVVRRLNKSVVPLGNLGPIADGELVAAFHLGEADPDRLAETSEENRRFLLGGTAEGPAAAPACSACLDVLRIAVPATHGDRYGRPGKHWCSDHAAPGDPPLATDTTPRPSERRRDGWPLGGMQELEGY